MRVMLRQIAHTRSGDKGDISNTSVIAYAPAFYPYLCEQLTAEAFRQHYAGVVTGRVERFELPDLHAMNFVAYGALGGGVSRSLALDNYGKALASAVLRFEIDIPDALRAELVGPRRD